VAEAGAIDGVEGGPEGAGGGLRGVKGVRGGAGVLSDFGVDEVAPNLGVDVGGAVEGEVACGGGVCVVEGFEAAGLLGGDGGHAGLVRVEGGEGFGRGSGHEVAEGGDEGVDLGLEVAGEDVFPGAAHADGEVHPEVGMGSAGGVVRAFLLGEVAQNFAAEAAVGQAGVKGAKVGGEGGDVVPVLGGVGGEVVAGEGAGGPGLVEGVFEEIEGD